MRLGRDRTQRRRIYKIGIKHDYRIVAACKYFPSALGAEPTTNDQSRKLICMQIIKKQYFILTVAMHLLNLVTETQLGVQFTNVVLGDIQILQNWHLLGGQVLPCRGQTSQSTAAGGEIAQAQGEGGCKEDGHWEFGTQGGVEVEHEGLKTVH